MSEHHYSDEYLNAYIDGELDKFEAGRLLDEMRRDKELNNRVTDLQKIREMVRYAYEHTERTEKNTITGKLASNRTWLSIAASLVLTLGISLGWTLHKQSQPDQSLINIAKSIQGYKTQVQGELNLMLHVTTADKRKLNVLLNETENALKDYKRVNIDILANGKGLNLFRADTSEFGSRIADMKKRYPNLNMKVCLQALKRLQQEKGIKAEVLPEAEIVPSALGQIIKRKQQGWAYIKI